MRHQILEVEEEAVTIAAFDEAARAALARIPLSLIRDDALKLSAKLVVEVPEWRVETVELRLQCDHLLLARAVRTAYSRAIEALRATAARRIFQSGSPTSGARRDDNRSLLAWRCRADRSGDAGGGAGVGGG